MGDIILDELILKSIEKELSRIKNTCGNPLNNVIKFLESEKSRRIKALESNNFCDNITIQKNINKIDKCLDIIKED